MAQQMLNVSNSSTATQQAGGKCLSQIVRGNICNTGPPKRGFLCTIVLYSLVSSEPAREYVFTVNQLSDDSEE